MHGPDNGEPMLDLICRVSRRKYSTVFLKVSDGCQVDGVLQINLLIGRGCPGTSLGWKSYKGPVFEV
jgi:hypothetical protein